jgi:hypothetical protein
MSPRLARMIHAFEPEHTVEHHDDTFDRTTADLEWIRQLADREKKWFVISGDLRILRNKAEAAVLRGSQLTFFALKRGWINIGLHEQAWRLVKVWSRIVDEARKATKPTVFEVPVNVQKIDVYGLTSEL